MAAGEDHPIGLAEVGRGVAQEYRKLGRTPPVGLAP